MLAGPLLALASISGCGGAAVHPGSDARPSGDTPTPAIQSAPTATAAAPDPAEEPEPIARVAPPSGAPRPPGTRSLFPSRGAARTPARVMEGVRRAVRERSEAIFDCYAPQPCGPHGAEPSRVVLSLTVAATGEVSPPRTLRVTHYRWEGEDLVSVPGDVAGELASCVERALRGLTAPIPPESALELHYPVAPEVASCEGD